MKIELSRTKENNLVMKVQLKKFWLRFLNVLSYSQLC